MNQIFTAGYAGHTPAQLKKAVDGLNAVVIDIRCSPRSRIPGWNGAELETLLPKSYEHLPSLGNLNYGGNGSIRIANMEHGMSIVVNMANRYPAIILLCGCSDYNSCHRRVVSEELRTYGIETQELAWPELETAGTMKCISLWQPWASLIAIGAKRIETRSWATSYSGPLAIHAAKTLEGINSVIERREGDTVYFDEPFRSVLKGAGIKTLGDLPFGAIIAVCELERCTPTVALTSLSEQESAFGNYAPGRFAWFLKNIQPLKEPIPYRGAQGLFNVEIDPSHYRKSDSEKLENAVT